MTAQTAPAVPPARAPLPAFAPPSVHPPPFRLPGEHFVAALLWLGVGAAGLMVVAPELATGNVLHPRVFAVTHCFTLGVITSSIFGALYQLFPVTMGRAVRSIRLAHATFWLLQGGTVLLTAGLWLSRGGMQGLGWAALALATGLFGVNLISQVHSVRPDRAIAGYVAAGYLAFLGALGLGMLRIGETLGYGHVDRMALIASHFHLAALGFATSVGAGIGSRMLPMFLVSHGFPGWPMRWMGPVAGAGLVVFVAGQLGAFTPLVWIGGVAMAAGVVLYLYLVNGYFRRRARRRLDPGLAHVAAAFIALGAAVPCGLMLLASPQGFQLRAWAAYALLGLLGWLVLLIVGIMYKILPFLTWLHLFGAKAGTPELPTVADLAQPWWGWCSFGFLVAGLGILLPAVVLGAGRWASGGAVVFAVGVGLLLGQSVRVLRMRYA